MRNYFVSLFDQITLSGFGFLLSFILIRAWTPDTYGVYSLCQALALLSVGIQNALINAPMNVFVPATESQAEKAAIERTLSSANLAVICGSFVCIAVFFYFYGVQASSVIWAMIGAYGAAMLLREYARSVAFGRQRPVRVLAIDGFYILLASSIFVLYAIEPEDLRLAVVIGVIALAAATSGAIGVVLQGPNAYALLSFSRRTYRPIWKEARWSLFGVATAELQARGYIYLVTAMASVEALGVLAAGKVLFAPMGLLLNAWGRVARPQLAQAAAGNQHVKISKIVNISAAIALAAVLGLSGVIYLAWSMLQHYLFRGAYQGIEWIVFGWGVVSLANCLRAVVSVALQSFKQFRPCALATFYGSVASIPIYAGVLLIFNYKLIFVGALCGELIAFLFMGYHYLRELKQIKVRSQAGP